MRTPGPVRLVRHLRSGGVPATFMAASLERRDGDEAKELRAMIKQSRAKARRLEVAPGKAPLARYWRARADRHAAELAALVKRRRARRKASR